MPGTRWRPASYVSASCTTTIPSPSSFFRACKGITKEVSAPSLEDQDYQGYSVLRGRLLPLHRGMPLSCQGRRVSAHRTRILLAIGRVMNGPQSRYEKVAAALVA